jgi:hypothetical protein
MLVPLYGFVQGDTMGVLVLAHDDMSVAEVIDKLTHATALRAGATHERFALFAHGRRLDEKRTVREQRLSALERIDLRREDSP